MKKKEVVRAYNFSDGKLITTSNEKIAYIRRDEAEFVGYGITNVMVDELENQVNNFSDTTTDVEMVEDQSEVTAAKDVVADKLKESIRGVMNRVVLKYDVHSAKYRKFASFTFSFRTIYTRPCFKHSRYVSKIHSFCFGSLSPVTRNEAHKFSSIGLCKSSCPPACTYRSIKVTRHGYEISTEPYAACLTNDQSRGRTAFGRLIMFQDEGKVFMKTRTHSHIFWCPALSLSPNDPKTTGIAVLSLLSLGYASLCKFCGA